MRASTQESVAEFRARAAKWIEADLPPIEADAAKPRDLQRMVFDAGFAGIAFPAEYADAQLSGMPDAHVRAVMRDNLARFLDIPS